MLCDKLPLDVLTRVADGGCSVSLRLPLTQVDEAICLLTALPSHHRQVGGGRRDSRQLHSARLQPGAARFSGRFPRAVDGDQTLNLAFKCPPLYR